MSNYKILVDQIGSGDPAVAVSDAAPLPIILSPVATTGAPTNSAQAALATSKVVKASAGTLYGVSGYNSKASAQFIQLHDAAALPADAVVPVHNISVGATSNFSIDFGSYGMSFATGIVVCNSSTSETKTIGSADCQFFARYK